MKKLILALLIASTCRAQDSKVHSFRDTTNIILMSAAAGADIWSTKTALKKPNTYEANPIIRPIVGDTKLFVTLKVAALTTEIGIAYYLHQTGHHKAERVVPVIFSAIQFGSAIQNREVK